MPTSGTGEGGSPALTGRVNAVSTSKQPPRADRREGQEAKRARGEKVETIDSGPFILSLIRVPRLPFFLFSLPRVHRQSPLREDLHRLLDGNVHDARRLIRPAVGVEYGVLGRAHFSQVLRGRHLQARLGRDRFAGGAGGQGGEGLTRARRARGKG